MSILMGGIAGAAMAVVANFCFGMNLHEKRWWVFMIGFLIVIKCLAYGVK